MKLEIVTITTLAMNMGASFGAVALNFNAEFDTGVPQNFSNAAGTPSNGLIWGVLVDSSGNGVLASSLSNYNAISGGLVAGSTYVLNTTVSSVISATDDILTIATATTADTSGSTEGDGITPGGVGGFYDIIVNLTNGVGLNDKFYIVWFDGACGGVLSDPSFLIPADGSNSTFGTPFVGVDPFRTAGLAYEGNSGVSTGTGFSSFLCPEPSTALLSALTAFGLFRRR